MTRAPSYWQRCEDGAEALHQLVSLPIENNEHESLICHDPVDPLSTLTGKGKTFVST